MISSARHPGARSAIGSMSLRRNVVTVAITCLILAFTACDDESSFAPRDDESSSSIEDVTPQSSEDETSVSSSSAKSSSSVIPASSGNLQSSSSKKESSSSAKSSSSVTPKSSSSETSVSSSSAKSSSSVTPKSSSSVKSSSSFEVDTARLCTPDYDLCDRALSGDSIRSGAYKQFTDKRNGRKYYYLTINGENKDGQAASVTVMAENLNIGEMVDGAKDQSNDSKIERYCYENDESNCEEFGGLYQWAEAMQLPSECNTKSCADLIQPNHRGICPDGWRLLTYDDFYIVVHADGNRHGVEDVRAMGFGGYNYSGYSLIGGGMRITPSGGFKEKDEVAYWFYPGENEYENYSCGDDGYSGKTSTSLKTNVSYKQNGLSIRCVKLD